MRKERKTDRMYAAANNDGDPGLSDETILAMRTSVLQKKYELRLGIESRKGISAESFLRIVSEHEDQGVNDDLNEIEKMMMPWY